MKGDLIVKYFITINECMKMKFAKKTLTIFIALFIFVSFASNLFTVKASDATTLHIHYYRFANDYEGWTLWLWPNEPVDGAGQSYNYSDEDDFGKLLTLTLDDTNMKDSTKIGIISKRGDWVEKDIDMDRYIDLTNPDDLGEVHVYLVQNDPIIYYNLDDADISPKILNASFIDENTVSFQLTKSITSSQVSLKADGEPISFTNFKITNFSGTLDVEEMIDLTKKYTLEVTFDDVNIAENLISFEGFYSSDTFNETYGYDGKLGAIYTDASTTFRLWAPISDDVKLNLYTHGHIASQLDYDGNPGVDDPMITYDLEQKEKGVWETIIDGDLEGKYYTFSVTNGNLTHEIVDPYAFSTGINGKRGMVVDFSKTNPEGFETSSRPSTMEHYTDAIIYELHVRDFTSHETWNGTEEYRGKFLGLTETGTTYQNVKTGLDHILELGVTHVQLIPVFDHGIIDETRLKDPSYYGIHDGIFNWGYMPENFNTLEGSYSTNPYDGYNRIYEFKNLVNTFHQNDIRVIMDVVYNHTGKSADSNFDLILPGYYFRMNTNGTFSNGSGTGNETASERIMFQKYMIDSLLFYAREYKIDGFRFDLMKLHDVETMNLIVEALHEIDPTIMVFGEPWTGGTSQLPEADAAYSSNLDVMPGVAVFNDDTRDGIKGSVFTASDKGFVQGNDYSDTRVNLGVTGATMQPNLMFASLPKGAWAINPTQSINYVTAHDNNTLHDKLVLSTFETIEKIILMQRQANAIILTSQGIPFLHAGVEMMRTKPCVIGGDTCDSANKFDHNSYKSPDETNQIDWNWKVEHFDTFTYYQSLIALRKMKDVFRLPTAALVEEHLLLIPDKASGFVSYFLYDETDDMKTIYVLHNNGSQARDIHIQNGEWQVIATTEEFGEMTENGFETLYVQQGNQVITLEPNQTLIMYEDEIIEYVNFDEVIINEPTNSLSPFVIVGIVIGSLGLIGAITFLVLVKRKK